MTEQVPHIHIFFHIWERDKLCSMSNGFKSSNFVSVAHRTVTRSLLDIVTRCKETPGNRNRNLQPFYTCVNIDVVQEEAIPLFLC